MDERVPAYILARPGRIRDSLVALLRAIPQIGPVQLVHGDLRELQSIPVQNRALVLLDASLINQEMWSYMKQMKGKSFHTHCKYIVLADTAFQRRMAQAAGADDVLLAGFPAGELFDTIDNLFGSVPVSVNGLERKNGPLAT